MAAWADALMILAQCATFDPDHLYTALVKANWKRTSEFTTLQYRRISESKWGILSPDEVGTRAETSNDTSAVKNQLARGKKYELRVYASTYTGLRRSPFSNIMTKTTKSCLV